jgi:hypothetical protein
LKNNDFWAAVVPVRTIDQLRNRETNLALRLEPSRRLHQPDIAFLNEVAHWQAVITKPAGRADH